MSHFAPGHSVKCPRFFWDILWCNNTAVFLGHFVECLSLPGHFAKCLGLPGHSAKCLTRTFREMYREKPGSPPVGYPEKLGTFHEMSGVPETFPEMSQTQANEMSQLPLSVPRHFMKCPGWQHIEYGGDSHKPAGV
jgi:hypothetical protein